VDKRVSVGEHIVVVRGLGFEMGAFQEADLPVRFALYWWSLLEGPFASLRQLMC